MTDPKFDPTKTHLAKEHKHGRPLTACRYHPQGKLLYYAGEENAVQRFTLDSSQVTPLKAHDSWVRAFAFSADHQHAITGGYDGRLAWWRIAGDKPGRVIDAHAGWIRGVAVSPTGQWIATSGNDNLVKVWSAGDGKPHRELAGHTSHVYAVAFHPDGKSIASADLKGVVHHWDLETGKSVRTLDASKLWKYDPTFMADIGGIRGIAFSPDGSMLACSGITNVSNAFAGIGDPLIVLFDWQSGKPKQLHKPEKDFRGVAWNVVFHPTGIMIAVGGGGSGGALWFFKPDQEKSFHTFALPNSGRDMHLHPAGLDLAVAHVDGGLRFYRMTAKV